MKNKRDATPEETEAELVRHATRFNLMNPSHATPEQWFRDKQAEAVAEGYKSEICGQCGACFLAFHHWTTCQQEGCPMSDGVSMLERMEQADA